VFQTSPHPKRYLAPVLLVAALSGLGAAAVTSAGPVHRAPFVPSGTTLFQILDEQARPDVRRVEVSLRQQIAVVYGDRGAIAWARVTTGGPWNPTPVGDYRILDKIEDYVSAEAGGISMPNTLMISETGIALHGGSLHTSPVSGGCIRLPEDFSAWLFAHADIGTPIYVGD
jgi:lipoprotein-anchoring transpeptidase ErfK/SrfK